MSLVRSTGSPINIIETGSNANGNWIKFDGGIMICTIKKVIENFAVVTQFSNLFLGSYEDINYPCEFKELYSASINPYVGRHNCWALSGMQPTNSKIPGGFILATSSFTETLTMFVTLVGTWK